MELLVSVMVGTLVAGGVYLLLRPRSFSLVLGYTLLGYAVNLMLFASGGLTIDSAPLLDKDLTILPDPLPQALVLTAIVIGFGMTAFLVVLSLRAFADLGTDHVDGLGVATGDPPGRPASDRDHARATVERASSTGEAS